MRFAALILLLGLHALAAPLSVSVPVGNTLANTIQGGIRFTCSRDATAAIEGAMPAYLAELDIPPNLVQHMSLPQGELISTSYALSTPMNDQSTLDFARRAAFKLHDDTVRLPSGSRAHRTVHTVSRKEILLALLQHGQLTDFTGEHCSVAALRDHIGIRQNTVAWAESLNWRWPNGGSAAWNKRYWKRGTPVAGHPLHEAVADVFVHQSRYAIGCYTATKLVMLQGVLDYYARVRRDLPMLHRVEARLLTDHEPLENVEPGRMWDFEPDFDAHEATRPGKLLAIQYGVAPYHFIPGDWIYLLNTDPVSYQKTGYEGSNAIYLGRGRFDDYYNDNNHSYTFAEKLDEVHQWRNGVFSRSRDAAKIRPLSAAQLAALTQPPTQGGLLLDLRVAPYIFAKEAATDPAGKPASAAAITLRQPNLK